MTKTDLREALERIAALLDDMDALVGIGGGIAYADYKKAQGQAEELLLDNAREILAALANGLGLAVVALFISVHAVERFLDPHDDLFFDLLRGGAGPGHRDAGAVHRDGREDLAIERVVADETADNGDDHDQVGGDGIPRPPADNAAPRGFFMSGVGIGHRRCPPCGSVA